MALKELNKWAFSGGSTKVLKNVLYKLGCSYSQVKHASTGKRLSKAEKSVPEDIPSEYFDKNLCSRLKKIGYVYLNDPVSAASIATHLCHDWKKGYIFEANPGPGILSNAILNTGVPYLRAFEKNKEFLPALEGLSNTHSNLEIVEEDILFLPSFEARKLESNVNEVIFNNIPECSWGNEVPFRLFSIISSKKSIKFLRFLLAILPKRASIYSYGCCEFFLLLKESEFKYMTAEPQKCLSSYRWITVLYNLFFEIKCLDKFAPEIFYPKPLFGKKKIVQDFYLVKLSPRHDLFTSLVNRNKLSEFHFFIRHHLVKRTGVVIPTMEGWIPSCGPRLIKEGMNVFTKFGDLSPKQLLLLFNQFSSWPEYEHSAFHAALETFNAKGSVPHEDEDVCEKF